jgi:hypothetical protein
MFKLSPFPQWHRSDGKASLAFARVRGRPITWHVMFSLTKNDRRENPSAKRGDTASPTHRSIHGHSIFVSWRIHRHQRSISPIHSSDNKNAVALQHLTSFFLVTVLLAFGFHSASEALAAGFSRRGRRRLEQAQAFRALRHAAAPT